MEQIIEYLKNAYDPLTILVYGSYADGSNNAGSDFDALVISGSHREFHDVSFVDGIQLDVFIYPAAYFEENVDLGEFPQFCDGIVVWDTDGRGQALKQQVISCLAAQPAKSEEEICANVAWCRKMLRRSHRGDAEGSFRWHWVLTESLEIFCDTQKHPYQGPKKSLRWMQAQHPAAFELYQKALFQFDQPSLEAWVDFLEKSSL